jgi:hypothetical protein
VHATPLHAATATVNVDHYEAYFDLIASASNVASALFHVRRAEAENYDIQMLQQHQLRLFSVSAAAARFSFTHVSHVTRVQRLGRRIHSKLHETGSFQPLTYYYVCMSAASVT